MNRAPRKLVSAFGLVASLLALSVVAFAQDPQGAYPPNGNPPSGDSGPGWHQFSNSPAGYPPPGQAAPPEQPVPPTLTLQAGTYVTVRVDQMLSSDRNKPGDGFSTTLVRPLVADGVVVAPRGQMLGGRVAEAEKAGRVKGVSRLGVQLTDLTLADGQQLPIETFLTNLTGPTSNARDAGAIAGTTAFGAAVGASAAWGAGAAIGAGAGLIASTVGVLLTRGHPTVIYPESLLTFRLAKTVTISTQRAPQAFHFVDSDTYGPPAAQNAPPPAGSRPGWPSPPLAAAPAPYYYYPYPYYYWYPGFAFRYGPRYYYRFRR